MISILIIQFQKESMPGISGKTIIVTGANSCLGIETARELARKGGTIIMACRNLEKSERRKAKH